MSDDSQEPVYFGVKDGRIAAVVVIAGNAAWRKSVAKDVADWIKEGCEIMNGTVGEARRFLFGPVSALLDERRK